MDVTQLVFVIDASTAIEKYKQLIKTTILNTLEDRDVVVNARGGRWYGDEQAFYFGALFFGNLEKHFERFIDLEELFPKKKLVCTKLMKSIETYHSNGEEPSELESVKQGVLTALNQFTWNAKNNFLCLITVSTDDSSNDDLIRIVNEKDIQLIGFELDKKTKNMFQSMCKELELIKYSVNKSYSLAYIIDYEIRLRKNLTMEECPWGPRAKQNRRFRKLSKKNKEKEVIPEKSKIQYVLQLNNSFEDSKKLDHSIYTNLVEVNLVSKKETDWSSKKAKLILDLNKPIDKGGFSQVFAGELVDLTEFKDKRIAVKIIPYSEEYKEVRFSEESTILKEINFLEMLKDFEGSVNMIGYSKSEKFKVYYIIFEYFETDLYKFLNSTKDIPFDESFSIINQMTGILSYLQKNGILHRDLKAQNFLLNLPKAKEIPKLKICDFGIALFAKEIKESFNIAGTRMFLAPEYINIMQQSTIDHEEEVKENIEDEKIKKELIDNEDKITISEEFTIKSSSCFKSDVFSFGLNILHLFGCNIRNCNKKEDLLKERIVEFEAKSKVSPELAAIVKLSLEWDKEKRPDFIYIEDYLIYLMHCPVRFTFNFDWTKYTELYVSCLNFEEIKNITDKDKIFQYFVDNGWKSTRISTKFIEIINLASSCQKNFHQDFNEAIKTLKVSTKYEEIIKNDLNNKLNPFTTLCKIYSVENGEDSVYKILNKNIGFDKIEGQISIVFLKQFLKNIPRSLAYLPKEKKVYRGLPTSAHNHSLAFKLRSEYLPGTIYYWTAFVSASKNKNVALKFLNKNSSDEGILFKILITTDKRKYDIQQHSQFKSEAEILLAPYFYFRVVSNKPKMINSKNVCCITVEEKIDTNMPLKVIWVDAKINNKENKEYNERIGKLGLKVYVFDSKEHALEHLKENQDSNYFVLSSGSLGKDFLPQLNSYENVRAVGVFCRQEDLHKDWAKKELIPKLVIFTSKPEKIIKFLELFSLY